jgi:hypothetical protein
MLCLLPFKPNPDMSCLAVLLQARVQYVGPGLRVILHTAAGALSGGGSQGR